MKYYYQEGGGVTISTDYYSFHTFRDYGLILRSATAPIPDPDTNFLKIPYRDGAIDLTAPYGEEFVTYNDRMVTIVLTDLTFRQGFMARFARLANNIHGKKVKLIFDKDPSYYYLGRCISFSDPEVEGDFATTTIVFECDPYRYSVYDATHRWEWDPFNFYTDMALDMGSYEVNGTLTKTINVGEKDVTPSFTTDSEITLEFEGRTYTLTPGTTRNFDIVLRGGVNNVLKFTGHGTVTIDYQGGRF